MVGYMVTEQKKSSHNELKQAMKEAFVEALREERDLVREIIIEAFEDSVLLDAIREGEKSELADRNEVSDILSKSQWMLRSAKASFEIWKKSKIVEFLIELTK